MWCSYQHDWLQSYQDAEYISNDYEEICHGIYALITQKNQATIQGQPDSLFVHLLSSRAAGILCNVLSKSQSNAIIM